jgi:UDP-glucose 4-epimerase
MSRLVVAGGTGLLGRYFLDGYAEKYDEILVLTRQESFNNSHISYIQTNYEIESLSEVTAGADAIVILAGQRGQAESYSFYLPSVNLCSNLYHAAAINKIKKVVFASSISVYNNISQLPWKEDSEISSASLYGVYKQNCENLGNWYASKFQIDIVNLRFAHLYGANEMNSYMINTFMRRAFQKETLEVDESAKSLRDFLYAKDAAKAINCALMNSDVVGSYNITAGDWLRNQEVAEIINEAFDNKGNLTLYSPKIDNSRPSYMTGELAKKKLGFEADYRMHQAMKEIHREMRKA